MNERLMLRAPVEKTKRDGSPFHIFTTVDGKRKFTCWDNALVAKWVEAKLENVTAEYVVSEPKDPKQDPSITGIVGVYAKTKGSGGFKSGPMFTDRQVALLAYAIMVSGGFKPDSGRAPGLAEMFRWLSGAGDTEPRTKDRHEPVADRAHDSRPTEPAVPDDRGAWIADLRARAIALHDGDALQAARWVATLVGQGHLEDKPVDKLDALEKALVRAGA